MSCSKECHRCIQFAVTTTERVDMLEKNVERGFAGLEARLEGKTTPSRLDIAASGKSEEDKHTIKTYESLHTLGEKVGFGDGGAEGKEIR